MILESSDWCNGSFVRCYIPSAGCTPEALNLTPVCIMERTSSHEVNFLNFYS